VSRVSVGLVQSPRQFTDCKRGDLTMAIPFPSREALRDSITSGTFVDAKFWVFSKRGSRSERVGGPKALFANGHVVHSVPRLASRAAALGCLRYLS